MSTLSLMSTLLQVYPTSCSFSLHQRPIFNDALYVLPSKLVQFLVLRSKMKNKKDLTIGSSEREV